MNKTMKFASQIDEKVFKELKQYADESDRSISGVLTDAVSDYLKKVRVRPAFRKAVDEVLNEHADLLERLAK